MNNINGRLSKVLTVQFNQESKDANKPCDKFLIRRKKVSMCCVNGDGIEELSAHQQMLLNHRHILI